MDYVSECSIKYTSESFPFQRSAETRSSQNTATTAGPQRTVTRFRPDPDFISQPLALSADVGKIQKTFKHNLGS